ncbi:MobA/MobL family protein [Lachnobacterium bovis]|uniref:MobA/MobL family protein n=1 Tax=Lachnobacterium bovis TaxID=140626 RepID=A0A1H9UG78_9FIRM|nr:MobA/MobL family protein [Lachnobacterium bovis]SES08446.1 MobA/MobL family protein [Lachnobacterium bovis]
MPKWMSTRFSVMTRGGNKHCSCPSAIDAAGYISREELYSEYDGHTYKPDPKEDLVHKEIDLPENEPKEYQDRAALWNSVEAIEKQHNAQLCRMFKASLPNDWTYEVAEEVVRKYVKDNFVSKGMCADGAINDSVNEKGQRNLHFHLLLTLRAIDENGKWMPKQKKIYILDKDGNKIRTKKGYKSKTEKTTDWDEPSKAKMWRKNLTELINETNDALKINEHWEHRSFKELGMEELPTIHLGSRANALEKKGIRTERGDYNRKVMEIRGLIDFITRTSASIENFKAKIKDTSNEVIELIESVCKRHKILQLPIISGKFLRKVSHRERLQDPNNMVAFVELKNITTFDSLQGYLAEHEEKYDRLNKKLSKGEDDPEYIKKEIKSELSGLAFAEVLDYNKTNEDRERANDKRNKEQHKVERKHRQER